MAERYTVHDTRVENKALIHDPQLPWIVMQNDRYPIVLSPRYGSQAEAEVAALGLNNADDHQNGEQTHAAHLNQVCCPPRPCENLT